jgi:hypothetical protein
MQAKPLRIQLLEINLYSLEFICQRHLSAPFSTDALNAELLPFMSQITRSGELALTVEEQKIIDDISKLIDYIRSIANCNILVR